jgi:aminoglycoside phosphotransferase (APT) family kinase protein
MSMPTGPSWEEALAQVPGAECGAALQVDALAGGTTNATFRVRTSQGVFVLRLHEPYSLDLGVDRRREALLHAVAAGAGLASRILVADPAGRFLVTEYLTGEPWKATDLHDENRLWALAQTLRTLHALPAPVVAPLDLEGLLERHIAQIAGQDLAAIREMRPDLVRARGILAREADAGRSACIVHGDLSHANMIGTGPQLIDWEYAAVADPLLDLACLAAYYPSVLGQATALLRRCELSATASVAALEDLAWVYRLLSKLWYRRLALAGRHPPPAH